MNKKKSLLVILALLIALPAWASWDLLHDLPDPQAVDLRLNLPSVRFEDRAGRLLYDSTAEQGGRHVVTTLDDLPLFCRQAAIAVEDRYFYSNPGVDLGGIARAVWLNLQSGQTVSGGSTITQQVARSLLLDSGERTQRTLRRKLREAFLAVRLTQRFSKDEILALYLNQTYYGGLSYGLAAAAQTYFAQPVGSLDLAQCALLAGLPQAPALYNPFTDLQAAQTRQQVVLDLMHQAGFISADQAALAAREPLILAETPYPIEAPHFVMMARAQVDALFTPEQVYAAGGLVVRTTLDINYQHLAESAIQRQLDALRRADNGLGHNVNSAALVALDPHTGQVLALVGSPDYFDSRHAGALNMAAAPLQPGSALKPVLYAAALDPRLPQPWTAATMLLDVTQPFQTAGGDAYVPTNYNFVEHGPISLRSALASSLNVPAVITMQHVGIDKMVALGRALGLTTLHDAQEYDLSLALGGGRVRLLDLTAAYAAFANTGLRVTPQILLDIRSAGGQVLYTPPPASQERLLDARVAWLISNILSDDEARRLGFGAHSLLELDRPAAVKTGTTSNFHDNWTVGYTPSLVVGVWAGNPDFAPMRDVTGLTGAAPIWHNFMRAALAGQPVQVFDRPSGLQQVEVCALSGLLPSPACPYTRLEWFIDGTQPRQPDTLYVQGLLDRRTGRPASPSTPIEWQQPVTALDLPPMAQAWARRHGLWLASEFSAPASGAPSAAADPALQGSPQARVPVALRLLSPASGSRYQLARSAPGDVQRLRVEAVGPAEVREVRLYVDGVLLVARSQAPYTAWWQLVPGLHRLWAEATLPDGAIIKSPVVEILVNE